MKKYASILLIGLIAYLLLSFACLNLNPFTWGDAERALFAAIIGVTLLFRWFISKIDF